MKTVLRGSIVLLLVVLFTAFAAVPVLAFTNLGAETVIIASDEVVEGDLYITGGTVRVDGTVNGDIFGVGQSLIINGTVNGGVTFAGQTMRVSGDIAHGARLAGATIVLNGEVGRDLVAAGAEVTVATQGLIHEDLVLAAGTVYVDGQVNGDILGGAGTITIADGVGGDIILDVDNLILTRTADIQGDVSYTSENEANIGTGASIAGTITRSVPEISRRAEQYAPEIKGVSVVWKVLSFFMLLIIGIILIVTLPRRITRMADSIQLKPWQSLGWGALIIFATPIAAIVVMCTVIGLPLGLISLALYGIAIYLSRIPLALLIGRLIIKQNRELESKGLMVAALALGLVILMLLRLIPYAGWVIMLIAIIFGLGTLVSGAGNLEDTER